MFKNNKIELGVNDPLTQIRSYRVATDIEYDKNHSDGHEDEQMCKPRTHPSVQDRASTSQQKLIPHLQNYGA